MDTETKELFNALTKEMAKNQEKTNDLFSSLKNEMDRNQEKTDEKIDAFRKETQRQFEQLRSQHEQMPQEINDDKLNSNILNILLKRVLLLENEVNILKEQIQKMTA